MVTQVQAYQQRVLVAVQDEHVQPHQAVEQALGRRELVVHALMLWTIVKDTRTSAYRLTCRLAYTITLGLLLHIQSAYVPSSRWSTGTPPHPPRWS
jgi:hypothetical protein